MDYGVAAGKRVYLVCEGGRRQCGSPCEADNRLAFNGTVRNDKGLCWYRRPDLNRHAFKGNGF